MKKTILIQSPQKFYEAVPIFYTEATKFGFFDKFYIATDHAEPYGLGEDCAVRVLKQDKQFSSNMLEALSGVDEDIFFVSCEDHILKGPNDKDKWDEAWEFALRNSDVGFLRLTNNNHVPLTNDDFFSPIRKGATYYVSLQPAIWRKEYFLTALKAGEDAWVFEKEASKRTNKHTALRSYCVKETVFHRTNFYKSGKYYRHKFAEYAIKNGIELGSDRKIHWKGKHYTFEQYKKARQQ